MYCDVDFFVFKQKTDDDIRLSLVGSEMCIRVRASAASEGYQYNKKDTTKARLKLQFNDDMTSTSLEGFFDNGILDSLRLSGMATTIYHIFEDSLYKGKNVTSGDTIIMSFTEKELNNILVNGGSQGKYIPDTVSSDIEYPLIYSAEKIDYHLKTEETELIGNAKAYHDNTDLEAGYIKVHWPTKMLNAHPRSMADSSYKTIKPTITEKGRDPMVGKEMIYNLDTKRGKIIYGKTKAALNGFVKAMAADYVKKGIPCNAILPGTVETPSWEVRVNMADDPKQARKDFINRQLMGRLAKPEEIASLAVYLASDRASYTTGTTITVDGGYSVT